MKFVSQGPIDNKSSLVYVMILPNRHQAISWTIEDSFHLYASPDLNELTKNYKITKIEMIAITCGIAQYFITSTWFPALGISYFHKKVKIKSEEFNSNILLW